LRLAIVFCATNVRFFRDFLLVSKPLHTNFNVPK